MKCAGSHMKSRPLTFDAILDYHSDNGNIFDELTQRVKINAIVPFVGAGLSAFAFRMWVGFLTSVCDKMHSDIHKKTLNRLVKSLRYEDAASFLETGRGKENFISDLEMEFGRRKLDQTQVREVIYQQAVYLLPVLFGGLVLTTNFDNVIEKVYEIFGMSFGARIGHPGHHEMLSRAISENVHTLYKFHGDISEPGRLVLTRQKYNQHYRKGSSLLAELRQCFKEKGMLFLGCSLQQDRTMTVLSRINGRTPKNYAIIGCTERERDEKARELGGKGIRAILYPEGEHRAVRVILERLLEIVNEEEYGRLGYYAGEIKQVVDSRFLYNAETLNFFGRSEEMERLKEFCEASPQEAVKWWAVTGAGGSGKSRLVYEFRKEIIKNDWAIAYPHSYDYESLKDASKGVNRKTLFIIDYVQYYARDIGKWIEQLYKTQSTIQKRLLLIERGGMNRRRAAWASQMKEGAAAEKSIRDTCYQEDFLSVQPLDQIDIQNIIKDYAENAAHPLGSSEIEMLYAKLQQIDPVFSRPLYALFLTDAYLSTLRTLKWNMEDMHEYIMKWNMENMLEYIMNRETDILKNSLKRNVPGYSTRIWKSFMTLKTMATVLGRLELPGEAELFCSPDWEIICKKAEHNDEAPVALLFGTGLLESFDNAVCLSAMEPDIIGEYCVLRWLIDLDAGERDAFIRQTWRKPLEAVQFYDRMFRDYMDIIQRHKGITNSIIQLPEFAGSFEIVIYTQLLTNLTTHTKGQMDIAVRLLEELYSRYQDITEVIIAYTKALFSQSLKQTVIELQETLRKLEALTNAHTDISEIIIAYANVLANLAGKQKSQLAAETLEKLGNYVYQHEDIPQVTIAYAKGLFNLASDQETRDAAETIGKLDALASRFSHVPMVAIEYAEALFNLMLRQSVTEEAVETVDKLKTLADRNMTIPEVVVEYAEALVMLAEKQDAPGAASTMDKLKQLVDDDTGIAGVVVAYAKGMVTFARKQDEAGAERMESRLEELEMRYNDIPQIVVEHARGLAYLCQKQDVKTAQAPEKLKRLADQHTDKPEVMLIYLNSVKHGYELA